MLLLGRMLFLDGMLILSRMLLLVGHFFFLPAMAGLAGGLAMALDHTVPSASLMDMVCGV